MKSFRRYASSLILFLILQVCGAVGPVNGQTVSSYDRAVGHAMLRTLKEAIKKNYYDPSFHGVNLDETFKTADDKINQATSNGQIFGLIAQAVRSLNDSHTSFRPPPRALHISYDWQIQMVGNTCYIMAIKPGTDAEAKGLHAGDILHVLDGYKVTRENFELLNYLYIALQPRTALSLVVQSPGEQPHRVDFNASTRQGKKALDFTSEGQADYTDLVHESEEYDHIYEHRFKGYGEDLFIWKMPEFDMPSDQVDKFIGTARKYKTLVIDLRGNPGGYIDSLLRIISDLFDHDVKLGDRKKRKETKPLVAKTRGHDIFTGQLIILIDSQSASCAELLSRVVQIEKRGIVVGDHSAGMVMESLRYSFAFGENSITPYGASITEADIIMSDGVSLEHTGVTPDKLMLVSGADLRAHLDPVLTYAASLAGVKLDLKEAGALFPIKWKLQP